MPNVEYTAVPCLIAELLLSFLPRVERESGDIVPVFEMRESLNKLISFGIMLSTLGNFRHAGHR